MDFTSATARCSARARKNGLVPIGRTALRLLESYLEACARSCSGTRGSRPCSSIAGAAAGLSKFLRLVHRHAARVGVAMTVTPHTFRRSCATEMIRGGANLYHVKDLLGHETLDTLRHYVKLNVEDLRKTLARCHPRVSARGSLDPIFFPLAVPVRLI